MEQLYSEIDQALSDSENNRVTSATQLRKKVRKWG